MADQNSYPLRFNCYKCGRESYYPNYLMEETDDNSVKFVVKRCTTCGAENKVEIPIGWSAQRLSTVLRGINNES